VRVRVKVLNVRIIQMTEVKRKKTETDTHIDVLVTVLSKSVVIAEYLVREKKREESIKQRNVWKV
jgi:beta-lactamase regulating signal transducer with metallopeptidase domain